MRISVLPALLFTAACGSSGSGSDTPDVSQQPSLFFGTRAGEPAANGLDFAGDSSILRDVDGAGPIRVKVVRALTDWDSGQTRLVISDEILEVDDSDIAEGDPNFTITLDGETLQFVDGNGPSNANGGNWRSRMNSAGLASGSASIFDYILEADPSLTGEFDTEAFFVFGFETDPAEIAALTGDVMYSGEFAGSGQLLRSDGTVFIGEVKTEGDINLTASFSDGSISGTVIGEYLENDPGDAFLTQFNMSFSTDIDGNGYAADLTCNTGCDANESIIAGTFFVQDALETSGLIGFDVQAEVPNPENESELVDTRFISGASYTAE